jgi:hypothetical protein
MTRRDQVLRAWIEKDSPRGNWQSCISHHGKVHRKSTHTRIRRAALQFNLLHISEVLYPTPTQQTPPHTQPELSLPLP